MVLSKINKQNRDVGGGDARNSGRLSDSQRTELFKLLTRFDAYSGNLRIVDICGNFHRFKLRLSRDLGELFFDISILLDRCLYAEECGTSDIFRSVGIEHLNVTVGELRTAEKLCKRDARESVCKSALGEKGIRFFGG